MTILVTEDHSAGLPLVERLLTVRGHTIVAAHGPQDASFLVEQHGTPPDALPADIILEGQTGGDLARTLKNTYPAVKIAFMAVAHRAPLRTGLGPVLQEPFNADELYRTIDEL